jgi:hypothetical protein
MALTILQVPSGVIALLSERPEALLTNHLTWQTAQPTSQPH